SKLFPAFILHMQRKTGVMSVGVVIKNENQYSITLRPAFLTRSRRQPLDQQTAVRLSRVPKAIVQPILPSLPKFDQIGFQSVTAPVRRQWNPFVSKALGHLRHPGIEHAPR